MRKRTWKTIGSLCLLMPTICSAYDGQFLTSFATAGREQVGFAPDTGHSIAFVSSFFAPAIQSDGKIVIEAAFNNGLDSDFGVLRFNADGSRDTTFGPSPGGQVIVPFDLGGSKNDAPNSIAVDTSGRIIVAGTVAGDESTTGSDCGVIRLTSAGELDTSFSGDGRATVGFNQGPTGQQDDQCIRVRLQGDGKILLAGSAQVGLANDGPSLRMAIARLTSSGTRDTSFNGNGLVTIDFGDGSTLDSALSIVEQSDGGILVVGYVANLGDFPSHAIARLTPSGALDPNFGVGGILIVNTDVNGYAGAEGELTDVMTLADDSFVVVGSAYSSTTIVNEDFFFAKFSKQGVLDTSFGTNGVVVVPFDLGGSLEDFPLALAVDSRGRFVATGFVQTGTSTYAMGVSRLTANGQPDSMFGNLGTLAVATGQSQYSDFGYGVALTPADTIVLTSLAYTDSSGDTAEVGVAELVGDTIFADDFENH
jgi:uncharacterized delta-60 repeat protein